MLPSYVRLVLGLEKCIEHLLERGCCWRILEMGQSAIDERGCGVEISGLPGITERGGDFLHFSSKPPGLGRDTTHTLDRVLGEARIVVGPLLVQCLAYT